MGGTPGNHGASIEDLARGAGQRVGQGDTDKAALGPSWRNGQGGGHQGP